MSLWLTPLPLRVWIREFVSRSFWLRASLAWVAWLATSIWTLRVSGVP